MLGPNDPTVRHPIVAGRFYPSDERQCRAEVHSFLHIPTPPAEKHWFGGLIPHAGWICSGAVAGQTIATLAAQGPADVIIIFGAIHTPIPLNSAALDSHPRWAVPTGESHLATDLQQRLLQKSNLFILDPRLHMHEHAIEVNLPLIQSAWADTPILPIEVPLSDNAPQIGRETAQAVAEAGLKAIYLASSDLTHYGPSYRFTPVGVGPAAMEWTKDNDRRLLRLIEALSSDQIVPEVRQRLSACGAGAIAALLGACQASGATSAQTLRHTTSYETLASVAPQPPHNAVGYAAVVVG